MPVNEEDVGHFPAGRGRTAPVRLIRTGEGPSATWLFASSTAAAAEEAYDRLGNRWLLDHLPGPLLRPGPKNLLWWQWLALPLALVLAWLVGVGLGSATRKVLTHVVKRTEGVWDDQLVARLAGPLALGWMLAALYALLPLLGLYPPAEAFISHGVQALVVVSLFWILLRLVDVSGQAVGDRFKAKGNLTFAPLIALGVRSAKGVVLALGAVAVLAQLGYPVTSLIAGLGVGGLALALAAQKTVENLFGAFSLAVDQPIREGDFVKVEDFVGTVEAIGLRSTRIRTLERTLISIPNGKLADMRLESLTARDRLRLFVNLGLVRETTATQMRAVIAGVERALETQEKVAPGFTVRFAGIDDVRLNVEMYCYIDTIDWNLYTTCRQELLLKFMEAVEQAGTRLAFPTHTLNVGAGAPLPAGAQLEVGR